MGVDVLLLRDHTNISSWTLRVRMERAVKAIV